MPSTGRAAFDSSDPFVIESFDEQLGELVAFGDRQAAIDEGEPLLDPVLAESDASEAADQARQVGLVGRTLGLRDGRFI